MAKKAKRESDPMDLESSRAEGYALPEVGTVWRSGAERGVTFTVQAVVCEVESCYVDLWKIPANRRIRLPGTDWLGLRGAWKLVKVEVPP